jgi:preprotein translocase subunit SecE
LVQRLFAAVHFTFGRPGRETEINLVTWANSREHIRNICVRYGTIFILTNNSKLKGSTEQLFWVVRAVLKSVARFFSYILCILDFLQIRSKKH